MSKRTMVLIGSIFLIVPLLFMGCGSDGSDGAKGATGATGASGQDLTASAKPETCAVCHPDAGDNHQAFYNNLYQDNVVAVTGLTYNFVDNNDVVTFTLTSKVDPTLTCKTVDNLNIYFAPYDNTGRFQFNPFADRRSIKGTLVAGANGLCTSTSPSLDNTNLGLDNGVLVVYGYDQQVGSLPPSRVKEVAYPYANILKIGTVNYVSAANVSGCEKCHIIPYLKHGNIYGQVNRDATTDFITCKACHLDNGPGGHFVWQLLVDDTARAGELWALAPGDVESLMDNTEIAKYAYKTRLMNDVHMSHAMEFEYPQSMANCATCHAGKLDIILADSEMTIETCKSCHPVTGSAQAEKPQPALADIVPHTLVGRDNCFNCHTAGGPAPFSQIHTGYDKKIYATDNGVKYSSAITVAIDNAAFDNNLLTIGFHATGTAGGLAAANIKPTVLVGLYGYDTKDYIVGPHETTGGVRNLEWAVGGAAHPRFTLVSSGGGSWVVRADLSMWSGLIDNGVVKRVEIAVMPTLQNAALPAGDNVVALNAPSRTYSLVTKAFVSNYFQGTGAIVNVAAGCNNCHDALATTFHTADRGGNIVVCRLCHITKAGGSHLEMASRSIDSYAHAIHTFQPFDIQSVDFDNAVQSMFYDLKVESQYPTYDRRNCVSCHNAGKFNVPDQNKSLPGLLSSSRDTLIGKTRAISGIPAYVSGPASRACGACHRAVLIKEDAASELASFNQHTKDGGYLLVPGDVPTLTTAINAILPLFNGGDIVVLP